MDKSKSKYDLEGRCLEFSKDLLSFCKQAPKSITNMPIINQLIRSGTAIGANYIEANDALGKKDFIHRLRIARKEAKETIYWLNLIDHTKSEAQSNLIQEATELRNILSAIIKKSESK